MTSLHNTLQITQFKLSVWLHIYCYDTTFFISLPDYCVQKLWYSWMYCLDWVKW